MRHPKISLLFGITPMSDTPLPDPHDDRTPFDIENVHNSPATFNDLPVAILVVDTRDRIILANSPAAEMYEGLQEGLTGQSILMLLPPQYQERFVEASRRCHIDGFWAGRLLMQTFGSRPLSIDAIWRRNILGHLVMIHHNAEEALANERDDARSELARQQQLFLCAFRAALTTHHPERIIERIEPFLSQSPSDVPIEHRGARTAVLVAIADSLLRCLVVNCLQFADYEVHEAESIKQAETIIAEQPETLRFALFDFGSDTQRCFERLQRANNTLLLIQVFVDQGYTDNDIPVLPQPLRPHTMLQAIAQHLAEAASVEEL